MAKATSAALSAAAQEYLLAIRSHSEAEGVTPSLVAVDLGVSKQAAAEMFRRLADDRLVAPCTGHARLWCLTPTGEVAADGIFLRPARMAIRSTVQQRRDALRVSCSLRSRRERLQ